MSPKTAGGLYETLRNVWLDHRPVLALLVLCSACTTSGAPEAASTPATDTALTEDAAAPAYDDAILAGFDFAEPALLESGRMGEGQLTVNSSFDYGAMATGDKAIAEITYSSDSVLFIQVVTASAEQIGDLDWFHDNNMMSAHYDEGSEYGEAIRRLGEEHVVRPDSADTQDFGVRIPLVGDAETWRFGEATIRASIRFADGSTAVQEMLFVGGNDGQKLALTGM